MKLINVLCTILCLLSLQAWASGHRPSHKANQRLNEMRNRISQELDALEESLDERDGTYSFHKSKQAGMIQPHLNPFDRYLSNIKIKKIAFAEIDLIKSAVKLSEADIDYQSTAIKKKYHDLSLRRKIFFFYYLTKIIKNTPSLEIRDRIRTLTFHLLNEINIYPRLVYETTALISYHFSIFPINAQLNLDFNHAEHYLARGIFNLITYCFETCQSEQELQLVLDYIERNKLEDFFKQALLNRVTVEPEGSNIQLLLENAIRSILEKDALRFNSLTNAHFWKISQHLTQADFQEINALINIVKKDSDQIRQNKLIAYLNKMHKLPYKNLLRNELNQVPQSFESCLGRLRGFI